MDIKNKMSVEKKKKRKRSLLPFDMKCFTSKVALYSTCVIRLVFYLQWPLLEDASQLLKTYHCLSASMLLICCKCNFIIRASVLKITYFLAKIYFMHRFH